MPHDLLAEKSLLGCLLIDSNSFDQISETQLDQEDFYDPKLGFVFKAIKELHFHSVVV